MSSRRGRVHSWAPAGGEGRAGAVSVGVRRSELAAPAAEGRGGAQVDVRHCRLGGEGRNEPCFQMHLGSSLTLVLAMQGK